MASAWGASWGVAWGSSWGVGAPTPPAFFGGGGFGSYTPGRTPEQIKRARERFGICDDRVPVRVCKVIAQVARQKVAKPDLLLDAALHRALDKLHLAYRAYYAEVLRMQIEELKRIEQDEEEAILLLM